MAAVFDPVSELKPFKTSWKIKVKIIRLWRQYSAGVIKSIEMVVVDSSGNKIHATVKEDLVDYFELLLLEGDSKIIVNFSLSEACGSYRSTKHPYKIVFNATTRVRYCDDLPYRLTGFQPVNFREILDGRLSPEYLVDIIGQIVEVSNVEIVSLNGKDTEKFSCELRNERDVRISLVVWGKLALDLGKAIQLFRDKTLICVVTFGKIKVWKDERSVCNAYNVTAIAINPSMNELADFLSKLPRDNLSLSYVDSKPLSMVSMVSEEEEFFVQTAYKTISEVLETRQVERCFLMCTIAAFDIDLGSYYMICKVCGTKVGTYLNNHHGEGTCELDVRFMAYCTKCRILNPKVITRYKFHMVVLDNTGHTKLLVLDNIALQLLHQPCLHHSTHSTSETQEPNALRSAMTNLVGKTYLFKIIIDSNNYLDKDDIFKVLKIITRPYMINEFDVSSYPKGLPNTFCLEYCNVSKYPQGSLMLSGGSNLRSESLELTPAKRKEASLLNLEEAGDHNSVTKMMCIPKTKKVKVDKSG